ncbi:hypothetical protein D3C81_1411560 [compost metagenome]
MQCDLVLGDAQFRLAGEVADAVHEELNVFLERRAGREWRLVATLQAVQHQAAARRQHIAQQRHLRTAQTIEDHIHTAVIGDLVDPYQQIFFLGNDDFFGAQRQQILTFLC